MTQIPTPRSWVHGFRVQNTGGSRQESPFFSPDVSDLTILSNKTLVVPMVSAANIPQLAVDILIASLSLSRLGTFDPGYLVPVVWSREGNQPGVTTPLELFGKDGVNFVVMQQRSPVLKAQKNVFISSLLEFVTSFGFKSVLFVSGVDPTNRTDSQMHTPLYHLYPSGSHPVEGSPLAALAAFPRYTTSHRSDETLSMPGGGMTRRIISSIPEDWTVNTGFLIWMGMEGDNRGDAFLTASAVAKILSMEEQIQGWKQPDSWQLGLFGTPNDQVLFS